MKTDDEGGGAAGPAEQQPEQQPPCAICGQIDGDSGILTYACNGSCGRQICEECSVEEEDRDEDSIICVECGAGGAGKSVP